MVLSLGMKEGKEIPLGPDREQGGLTKGIGAP